MFHPKKKKNCPMFPSPSNQHNKKLPVGKVPRCHVDEHVALPEDHANELPSELPAAKMGSLSPEVIEDTQRIVWTFWTNGREFFCGNIFACDVHKKI